MSRGGGLPCLGGERSPRRQKWVANFFSRGGITNHLTRKTDRQLTRNGGEARSGESHTRTRYGSREGRLPRSGRRVGRGSAGRYAGRGLSMSSVARDGWVGRRREQSRPRRRHSCTLGWVAVGHSWPHYLATVSINVNDVVHFWLADSPVAFGRAKQTVPGIDIRASCLRAFLPSIKSYFHVNSAGRSVHSLAGCCVLVLSVTPSTVPTS